MLWKIEPIWLVMALGAVSVFGFFFAHALDAILRSDGFGAFPTMFLFIGGFFGAIYYANTHGIALYNLTYATGAGLAGALGLLAVLVLLKAGASRLLR